MTGGAPPILIEGYTAEEVLRLTEQELAAFVLTSEAVVIRIGTAELLGRFRLQFDTLFVELAHVDNGGEGVLPAFWRLVRRFAQARGIGRIEWVVHAVRCAPQPQAPTSPRKARLRRPDAARPR